MVETNHSRTVSIARATNGSCVFEISAQIAKTSASIPRMLVVRM